MNDKDFAKYLETCKIEFQHFGVLVRNIENTRKGMEILPGIGEWYDDMHFNIAPENCFKGGPCKFRVLSTKLFHEIPIEFVEPDFDSCENPFFAEYFRKNEEGGIHHYSYLISEYRDFKKIMEELLARDYELLLYAKITEGFDHVPEDFFCEFCYLKPPYGSIYLELNFSGVHSKEDEIG